MKTFLYVALIVLLFSCCRSEESKKAKNTAIQEAVTAYNEPYRPQYHFTPKEKWMNDPNGLVFYKGDYHLFYQYYPDDIVWGPMHWGHAVSKDMVHWQHKPIALFPDENGLIFSGSAVIDFDNTSGFGTQENPPMVTVFTYHSMEREKEGRLDYQTQGIAYSLDNGDTWKKYEGNPVLKNQEKIKDYRDPKVFWHEASKQWVMLLVAGDRLMVYNSPDLKSWVYQSEFGSDVGAHGGVWECPDVFPLMVDDEEKWVLLISINPGGPNGGSATQYFVGDFDGKKFTSPQKEARWIDFGADNYAGVTYNNAPNNQRIFIGWMSNWNYARNTPTEVWRSAMTLPRNLSLEKTAGEYFLKSYPLLQIDSIIETSQANEVLIEKSKVFSAENLNQSEVKFTLNSRDFEMHFFNKSGDTLKLKIKDDNFYFDRTKSGLVDFEKSFGETVHQMGIDKLPKGETEFRMFLDWSSAEIFINKGQYVMTGQIFPKEFYTQLLIINTGPQPLNLKGFAISPVKRIW